VSEVRLSHATRTFLVQKHTTAAEDITGLAGKVPTSVEGGLGSPELLEILAAVVGTADDLAKIDEGVAALVDGVGNEFQATDEELAARLDKLADKVPE